VTRRRPTLEELYEKAYPFPDSELLGMLEDLLKKGIIYLLEPKKPKEVRKTVDPLYCRYHKIVNHALEKYITLKELIMWLIKEGTTKLDLDDVVETNHVFYQRTGLSLI